MARPTRTLTGRRVAATIRVMPRSSRTTSSLVLATSVMLAFLGLAPTAHGETGSGEAALARELFTQGRTLMDAQDFPAACAKFEESQRLDPGGGTRLNLALCHERLGRTATAWAEFNEALRIAKQDRRKDREDFAQQHIDDLTPRISRLRVIVPGAARVPGLVVRRNGVVVGEASWGEPIPVDPGVQTIDVSAPGMIPKNPTITIGGNGDAQSFTVDALEPVIVKSRKPFMYGAYAGGAAALGAGIFFGVRALGRQSAAKDACPSPPDNCRALGIDYGDQARTAGNVSTAFIVGAVVLVGVGTYMLFTEPKSPAGMKQAARLFNNVAPGGPSLLGTF